MPKGLFLADSRWEWSDVVFASSLAPGDVLVRPLYVAVQKTNRVSFAIGHACYGQVIEAGEESSHLKDTYVGIGPHQPCGLCDLCRRGNIHDCEELYILGTTAHGCSATPFLARGRWAVPMHYFPALSPETAAWVLGFASTQYAAKVDPERAPACHPDLLPELLAFAEKGTLEISPFETQSIKKILSTPFTGILKYE